jgi:hypothetical protein
MAKDMQGGISAESNVFNKGLVKDFDDVYNPEGAWSHARNAVNNSVTGKIGVIGNEPGNIFCSQAPYTIIGAINLTLDKWIIYSTDDINSEIGYFEEDICRYTLIVNDPCLGFQKTNLVIGISKENFDCSWQVYWADGLNPDRTMNVGNPNNAPYSQPWPGVPYICKDATPGDECIICDPKVPYQLDCDKIRLSKLMDTPCITVSKGASGGTLQNGSYYAVIAYSVNQQKVTDYFTPSNVQALFEHDNLSGSLLITVTNAETQVFDEFELVIVRTINQQTSAKKIGYYNTNGQIEIALDYINEALVTVPIEFIPIRTPEYEKSEAIYRNGAYALRVAPTSKFDFNYQPLANQIDTEWVMVEQLYNYYAKGGNQTGYMRDEQYAFWIRWIYNTGEKSSSYHIPGRPKEVNLEIDGAGVDLPTPGLGSADNIELAQFNDEGGAYQAPKLWEMINTAYATSSNIPAAPANAVSGQVVARGRMGYWESTEVYPSNNPDVWNASAHPWSQVTTLPYNTSVTADYDLCGKPIRHHKMPADIVNVTSSSDGSSANFSRVRANGTTPKAIRVLGVAFNNIRPPLDNNGALIPGIVGYEILRSSREGNKSVVAKGIINNMRSYQNTDNETIYYQNYPYNPLGTDHSLTSTPWTSGTGWNNSNNYLKAYSKSLFTFHSPDTQFRNPFLSAQELKLYGEVGSSNNVKGNFQEVTEHPKGKLPTDLSFLVSLAVGIGLAGKAVHGQETRKIEMPRVFNAGISGEIIGNPSGTTKSGGNLNTAVTVEEGLYQGGSVTGYAGMLNTLTEAVTGINPALTTFLGAIGSANGDLAVLTTTATATAPLAGGGIGGARNNEIISSDINYMPGTLRAVGGAITYANYMTQGTDATLDIIRGFSKYEQFALSYISHGDMHVHSRGNALHTTGNSRRYIRNANYLENQLQQFGTLTINNAYRGRAVVLDLVKANGAGIIQGDVNNPSQTDTTVQTVGTARNSNLISSDPNHTFDSFNTSAYSYYAGMKIRLRNQYGQMESVRQITTGCYNPVGRLILTSRLSSPVIFGGDIYVGRYTEKNTFFYFYDWMMNQPDGTEFDYRLRTMINNPRFWVDFTKFDTGKFIQDALDLIVNLDFTNFPSILPSGLHNLDGDFSLTGLLQGENNDGGGVAGFLSSIVQSIRFMKKNAWFYLFQSGVRDFFVESEINVDLRDWGTQPSEWHYDPYRRTDLNTLFNPDIIKSGNYFKYDLSLSISRIFNNFISWGNMQARYYNPYIAETCYTYYKNRIVYSLPQTQDAVKDAWKVYLANNYKDFTARVTAIKPIGKTGALILFDRDSPVQSLSSESMELDLGTKITIGDGSLFSQALQNLSNSDPEYQHGSCQNRLSVINTPAGIYYMSQSQGKIFAVTGDGLEEISAAGMRWWFNKYLPYTLLEDFPEFTLIDNPVVGIGCQSTFDNTNILLYFCKRDYRVKPEFRGRIVMSDRGARYFTLDGAFTIELGDPLYFEDTSWTISYDPKAKAFISFHDWHPELAIASKTNFLTTQTSDLGEGKIWRHNYRTDLFANYYGQDYPFEIEFISNTGQQVNTLKSIEYQLECYTYRTDGLDTYHVLDYNFDHAVITNTEQVSGVLNLNIMPKNNAPALVNYPVVNPTSIDILYSKVEQKYRFNQFWDITNDRGEYTYPNVQQPIWNTELNGYIRTLNTNNLNYQKPAFQHKKFRHYTSYVLLYRNISGPVKMLFRLSNEKNLNSPR